MLHCVPLYITNSSIVPPTVLASQSDIVVGLVGDNITLEFTITRAFPQVLPDDIQLIFTNSSNVNSDISDSAIVDGNVLVLSIANIQNEDEGWYTVRASNPAGSDDDTVRFEVEGKYI